MQKFCKQCGQPISGSERFCKNCGEPIEGNPSDVEMLKGNGTGEQMTQNNQVDTSINDSSVGFSSKIEDSSYAPEKSIGEKFFGFEGRLNRKRYVYRGIILWFGNILLGVLAGAMEIELLLYLGLLILTISSISLNVRRAHDIGKNGWIVLLLLVPLINIIFALYLLFKKGQNGPNIYGPDPLGI